MTDWTDPCARAAALREAYYRLLSGETEAQVRVRSGDVDQFVAFHATRIDALKAELMRAEAECAAAQGKPPRRFAIRLGSRR